MPPLLVVDRRYVTLGLMSNSPLLFTTKTVDVSQVRERVVNVTVGVLAVLSVFVPLFLSLPLALIPAGLLCTFSVWVIAVITEKSLSVPVDEVIPLQVSKTADWNFLRYTPLSLTRSHLEDAYRIVMELETVHKEQLFNNLGVLRDRLGEMAESYNDVMDKPFALELFEVTKQALKEVKTIGVEERRLRSVLPTEEVNAALSSLAAHREIYVAAYAELGISVENEPVLERYGSDHLIPSGLPFGRTVYAKEES